MPEAHSLPHKNCRSDPDCCPAKPRLEARLLIDRGTADDLAAVFKILAGETRLRLLHAIARTGEMCVTDLANAVGKTPQAVSNQLQHLSAHGIVGSRRDGTTIHYRIVDPCVPALLDHGLCLLEDAEARRKGRGSTADRPRQPTPALKRTIALRGE